MKLDLQKTAVLTLDLQQGIMANYPESQAVIPPALKVLDWARKKNIPVIHVGLGFREGYPEISPKNGLFSGIKQRNAFVIGTPSAEFHPEIVRPGDRIVYKHRVSAFTENDLHLILRSLEVEHLVLFGIATSGIVLSTVTRAFDLDFGLTVIEDACFDPDAEVHRVLIEKIYAKRGAVVKADAFLSA